MLSAILDLEDQDVVKIDRLDVFRGHRGFARSPLRDTQRCSWWGVLTQDVVLERNFSCKSPQKLAKRPHACQCH